MAREQETTVPTLMEPVYVEEPHRIGEYAEVFRRAAVEQQPLIISRREGGVAAVISLKHLELLQDLLARQQAESLASQIDWTSVAKSEPPAKWFDGDEPKPF